MESKAKQFSLDSLDSKNPDQIEKDKNIISIIIYPFVDILNNVKQLLSLLFDFEKLKSWHFSW